MIYGKYYPFCLQVLDKINLEVMDFWVFLELAIFMRFLSFHFKHFLHVVTFKNIFKRPYCLIMF